MKAVGIVILLTALAAGIWVLREETMTVHTAVPEDSALEIVVLAETRSAEDDMLTLTRAQIDMCVIESVPGARVVDLEELEPAATRDVAPQTPEGPRHGGYRATMEPAADEPDRAQLRGCLEDVFVRHLRLDVHQMVMLVDGSPQSIFRG